MERIGLLTQADLAVFAAYCQAMARWQLAEEDITANGTTFVAKKSGYTAPRPEVAIAREERKAMIDAGARFGLTPSDRRRMSLVTEPKKQRSGLLDVHKASGAS